MEAMREQIRKGMGALFPGADEQHRHRGPVPNLVNRAPENQITDQPVTVRRHCDQIAMLAFSRLENLGRGIAKGQVRGDFQSLGA
jgi:hypothetical protein